MAKKEKKKHALEKEGLVTELYKTLWHPRGVFGKSSFVLLFYL